MIDKIKDMKQYCDYNDRWQETFNSGYNQAIDDIVNLLERSDNSDYAVPASPSPKVCPLCLGDKEWENNQTFITDTCPCCNGTGQTFA